METYPMSTDWKTSYCSSVGSTQSKLQVQRNPYQNPNDIYIYIYIYFFFLKRKTHPKIHTKYQGTQNTRTIFKRKNKTGNSHFLILKLTKKLQYSKQCGIGIKIGRYTNK